MTDQLIRGDVRPGAAFNETSRPDGISKAVADIIKEEAHSPNVLRSYGLPAPRDDGRRVRQP